MLVKLMFTDVGESQLFIDKNAMDGIFSNIEQDVNYRGSIKSGDEPLQLLALALL
jgi:hypothetical protein